MTAPRHRLTVDSPIMRAILSELVGSAGELFDSALAVVPGSEQLPAGYFADDIVRRIPDGATVLLRAVAEGRSVTEAEVRDMVAPMITNRAEERIPLRLILTAYFTSIRNLWSRVEAAAGPDDLADLLAVVDLVLDLAMHTTITMAETHAEVEQSVYGSEREARRELCAALLAGTPADDLAARADIAVSESYTMLAVQVIAPEHLIPLADNAVARRRMRLAQQTFDELSATTALHTFDGTRGIALLPAAPGTRYNTLAQHLSDRFATPVRVLTHGIVPRDQLPESARELDEFSTLAHALHLPPGIHPITDLMLEYQLTRPGIARTWLADRLLPLLDHPRLLEALESHLRHGSDRKAAAAELHLHPNSLTYRLRRIADLTGLDPADPHQSRILAAARTIHHLSPPPAPHGGPNP